MPTYFRADLNPPLGRPGGPCQVVRRIDQTIRPPLKNTLTDKVEEGADLSNAEAGRVYDLEAEKTRGLVSRLFISPHAQYRMDLRGVTVKDLREALLEAGQHYHAARKHGVPSPLGGLFQGRSVQFVSSKGLLLVLAPKGEDAKLITTYWKGRPDPSPPGSCQRHTGP